MPGLEGKNLTRGREGCTFQRGCAILRISAFPNSFFPHSLSRLLASKLAGLPPLTMVNGHHSRSCIATVLQKLIGEPASPSTSCTAYLWTPNKHNKLHILRIYRWRSWHLWSHLLSTPTLAHALLAFAFPSTYLRCMNSVPPATQTFLYTNIARKFCRRAVQTCSCRLNRCDDLQPSVEGMRVPEKAECRNLLQ